MATVGNEELECRAGCFSPLEESKDDKQRMQLSKSKLNERK